MKELTLARGEHAARRAARPAQVPRPALRAIRRHWFLVALLFVGAYAGLPWLAPAFMRIGWTNPARAIYTFYSTQCHQMAQRSYFVFGPKLMYSPAELQAAGVTLQPLALRAFLGTPDLGWKVAWSDRMAAMYAGLFAFMIVARLLRHRLRPLPAWAFVVLLLPLALDGTTHLLSDLAGFGFGFRDTNLWLATLTGSRLGPGFYAGDAWGSFNAWMRLLSGVLFGLGITWLAVPRLDGSFEGDLLPAPPAPAASPASVKG